MLRCSQIPSFRPGHRYGDSIVVASWLVDSTSTLPAPSLTSYRKAEESLPVSSLTQELQNCRTGEDVSVFSRGRIKPNSEIRACVAGWLCPIWFRDVFNPSRGNGGQTGQLTVELFPSTGLSPALLSVETEISLKSAVSDRSCRQSRKHPLWMILIRIKRAIDSILITCSDSTKQRTFLTFVLHMYINQALSDSNLPNADGNQLLRAGDLHVCCHCFGSRPDLFVLLLFMLCRPWFLLQVWLLQI